MGEPTGLDGIVQNLVYGLDVLIRRGVQNDNNGTEKTDGASQPAQNAELLVEEVGSEDGSDQDRQGAEGRDENGWRKGVGGKVANLSKNHYKAELAQLNAASPAARATAEGRGSVMWVLRTCRNSRPPYRALQVDVAITFEAVSFFRMHESLESRHVSHVGSEWRRFRLCCATQQQPDARWSGRINTFFVITKLTPARIRGQRAVRQRRQDKKAARRIPIAKLDAMASARPMYLKNRSRVSATCPLEPRVSLPPKIGGSQRKRTSLPAS